MKKQKPLKNIKSSLLSRGFSLASLAVQAGSKITAHKITNLFTEANPEATEKRKNDLLNEQFKLISKEFGELKGSLMKAGQMLSVIGEHFLPPEANAFLKKLQYQSPPLEWKELKKILQKSLKKDLLAELEIEETAIASASLGQVHRAVIKNDNTELILKIQYTGLEAAIDSDITALKTLLSISKILPNIPNTDEIFDEVRTMLHQELNYNQELKMAEHFSNLLAKDPRYIVPKVFPKYSSKRVLTMSYEPGLSIDGTDVKNLSQENRNKISKAALDLYLRELFTFKIVQTDPHFGNYRIRMENNEPKLILYDFGATRSITDDFLTPYKAMLKGIYDFDRPAFEIAAKNLKLLKDTDPQELKDLFYKLCTLITEPFLVEEYNWGGSTLPEKVMQVTREIAVKFPLRSPPKEIIFLDRKMIGMFTFLSVLNAKIPTRSHLGKYLAD